MVTWRGFLARIGLVTVREWHEVTTSLIDRITAERDALRAENDNLKRAAAETLIDEPPFGHVWERTRVWDNPSRRFVDPRSGGPITVIGEPRITDDMIDAGMGQVDCLEGDKRRG